MVVLEVAINKKGYTMINITYILLNQLLSSGLITQEEYNKSIEKIKTKNINFTTT